MFQASGMYPAECFFQDFTGVFLFGEHLRLFSHHLETFMNPSLCPIVGAKAQAFRLWLVAVLSKSNQGCFPVLFVLGLPSIIRSEWQARSFQKGWAAFSFITRLASWKPTYPLSVGTFEWMIFLFPRWDMDLLPERVLFSPTFFQALHLWERLVVSGGNQSFTESAAPAEFCLETMWSSRNTWRLQETGSFAWLASWSVSWGNSCGTWEFFGSRTEHNFPPGWKNPRMLSNPLGDSTKRAFISCYSYSWRGLRPYRAYRTNTGGKWDHTLWTLRTKLRDHLSNWCRVPRMEHFTHLKTKLNGQLILDGQTTHG